MVGARAAASEAAARRAGLPCRGYPPGERHRLRCRQMTEAALLDDLNDAQRTAVRATTGPVVILAGAGTGKTRVISRRAAYAIATGVVPASDVLVVTFTDKAAGEMAARLAQLGQPGVTARTFHAHALSQLSWFWPSRHDGAPMPEILASKIPIVGRLARSLPGGYRFTTGEGPRRRDRMGQEPAHHSGHDTRRTSTRRACGRRRSRSSSSSRLYADYERAKQRAGRIDFDDMLIGTVELLEADEDARATVQARKRWISVDEYQDTNPLQERLLELWLGERTDLCVVGDPDQTIYTFTGATSDFLTGFAGRHPGATVVALTENHRSTPQILDLANRLIGRAGGSLALRATRGDGPPPSRAVSRRSCGSDRPGRRGEAAHLDRRPGPDEIAVLPGSTPSSPRSRRRSPRAGVPYQVRGQRFFDRREVRDAIELVRRGSIERARRRIHRCRPRPVGNGARLRRPGPAGGRRGSRARRRPGHTARDGRRPRSRRTPTSGREGFLADLAARAGAERAGAVAGVNLLTYHRAKGLEWDAVFLPDAGGGQPADQPRPQRPRRARGGAPAPVRGDHPGAHPPGPVVGGEPGQSERLDRSQAAVAVPRGDPAERRAAVRPKRRVRAAAAREAFVPPLSPAGEGVLAALKAWRTARARHDAVPAYVIAHDATLAALAEARPTTIMALGRVKGMGPGRLEKYGDEILAITSRADD